MRVSRVVRCLSSLSVRSRSSPAVRRAPDEFPPRPSSRPRIRRACSPASRRAAARKNAAARPGLRQRRRRRGGPATTATPRRTTISSACKIEPVYTCAVPGAGCVAAACGDGMRRRHGGLRRRNNASPGCSALCRLEAGFACPLPGKACVPTVCCDGKTEGTEQCDDSPHAGVRWLLADVRGRARVLGGTCVAQCGDGLKFPGEACDDGNSATATAARDCKLEAGFTCAIVVTAPPARSRSLSCTGLSPARLRRDDPGRLRGAPRLRAVQSGLCTGCSRARSSAEQAGLKTARPACRQDVDDEHRLVQQCTATA